MVNYRECCPKCFNETGYTIHLTKDEADVFTCTKSAEHRFKRNEDGHLVSFQQ